MDSETRTIERLQTQIATLKGELRTVALAQRQLCADRVAAFLATAGANSYQIDGARAACEEATLK